MKMKRNISLMKLTIRLLISMIFAVILFMVLGILYNSRYWPDVYNYINANITIKRIPTISELDFTIYEIEGTTEYYITADDYVDGSTVDGLNIDIDDFTNYDQKDDDKGKSNTKRTKRYAIEHFGNEYSEVPKKHVVIDNLFIEEPTTILEDVFVTKIVKDLISDSKLVPKYYGDVEVMTSLNEVDSEKMTTSILAFALGLSLMLSCLLIGEKQFHKEFGSLTAAFLSSFDRSIWAIGLCCIIISCEYGTLPIITSILSSKIFVVLGKLTYCNYLVHTLFLYRNAFSLRVPFTYDIFSLVTNNLGYVIVMNFVSFILWLFIEAPVSNIITLVLNFERRSREIVTKEVNDNGNSKIFEKTL